MTEWNKHWQEYPSRFGETDFLRQVGKTVNGKPISSAQLDTIVRSIIDTLSLTEHDSILDLCCGNGLVTARVAGAVKTVVGIDYSEPLLRTASVHHSPSNVQYVHSSVVEMEMDRLNPFVPFTKAYMYEALQHFDENEFVAILDLLAGIVGQEEGAVLFGSVPDRDRIWNFYDNPDRQRDYAKRSKQGGDAIGTWWERSRLKEIAEECGFDCVFFEQSADLHTSHYRFDLLLRPRR